MDSAVIDRNLSQSIPTLAAYTPFPSFDYVTKPYADALDAMASVLIIWTSTAVIGRLISLSFGRSSRSLAVRDQFDRLANMKISCKCLPHRHVCCSSYICSNFSLRIVAITFFIISICAEVVIVITQSTKWRTRSLDDLNLKSITLAVPNESTDTLPAMFEGCQSLLTANPSNTNHHLSICHELVLEQFVDPVKYPNSSLQFFFTCSHRFVSFSAHTKRNVVSKRYSIVINDPQRLKLYYANMSRLGFIATSSQVQWVLDNLAEFCYLCHASARRINSTTSVIRSELSVTELGMDVEFILQKLAFMMIQKSESKLTIADFLREDTTDNGNKVELHEFSRGRVKRVSGLMLWIAAGVLGIVNYIGRAFVWDMDRDHSKMVQAVLVLICWDSPKHSIHHRGGRTGDTSRE
ncbi:hypothetical protein FGB62_15g14 [Gracilaria domingensis]|nr:hypothetical protein FGB62_15g14 [Gracilaria domingensis]